MAAEGGVAAWLQTAAWLRGCVAAWPRSRLRTCERRKMHSLNRNAAMPTRSNQDTLADQLAKVKLYTKHWASVEHDNGNFGYDEDGTIWIDGGGSLPRSNQNKLEVQLGMKRDGCRFSDVRCLAANANSYQLLNHTIRVV